MTFLHNAVAVASGSGAPGVTTLCLAWAAAAAARQESVLVVEADPAGGSMAAYAGLAWTPGLATLAAALGPMTAGMVTEHSQPLAGDVRIVAAPGTAAEASGALNSLGDQLVGGLEGAATVLVDVGRFGPTSPAAELVSAAGKLVVVVAQQPLSPSGTAAAVARAKGVVDSAGKDTLDRTVVVVVGDAPYDPQEIGDVVDAPVLAVLPWDPKGAAHVLNRRSRLSRACETAWSTLIGAPVANDGLGTRVEQATGVALGGGPA